MNDAFCDVTGKDSRYRKNISNLFPEIDASALPCKKEETDVQIFIMKTIIRHICRNFQWEISTRKYRLWIFRRKGII